MNSNVTDTQNTDNIREQFQSLLTRANKERPNATDIQALKDLLYNHKEMELWKAIVGMGELAESQALDTIVNGSGQGMRECWRQRLQAMRTDLGYAESPARDRLLIQQITLCWLNLNLTEYRHTNVMKQSISFACGLYWEKRLTAAQRRFTRACETHEDSKMVTQHSCIAIQHRNRRRATGERHKVDRTCGSLAFVRPELFSKDVN